MTIRSKDQVPAGSPILTGPRGGKYYVDKTGKKIYIHETVKKPSRSFNPRRNTSFMRWVEAQSAKV